MSSKCVSIIVPIFNCESYIKNCIESLINQSYTNIEILLIDDGSKDNSGTICDSYANQYEHIRVFHIPNGGVSNARNLGLQKANGDYIQFVDGDDEIRNNMTGSLVHAIEESDVDMVVCGYERITRYITRRDKFWDKPRIYSNKEYLIHTLQDPTGYYYGVIWNKLYKKDVIKSHKIRFNSRLNLGEDFTFNIDYISCIRKVNVINERLYIYNSANIGSLSRYKDNTIDVYRKEFENRKIIFENYKKSFKDLDIYSMYQKQIYEYWQNYYFINTYAIRHGFDLFNEKDKQEWKQLLDMDEDILICKQNIDFIKELFIKFKIELHNIISHMKRPLKKVVSALKKIRG